MSSRKATLSLGLDSSTQSLTAVLVDFERGEVVHEHSLDYASDERLNGWGIDRRQYLVTPRVPGEADQPVLMYLASLDAMLDDLRKAGAPLDRVAVINVSGQQHGHLYLSREAEAAFASLRSPTTTEAGLPELLEHCFSYGTSPIWRTSNTAAQAEAIRQGVGGKAKMIELSGSDSPLRFTGAIVRRVAEQFPDAFAKTSVIQLISSFLPAVLTGNARAPIDFGNASGTSLLDYRGRVWSNELIGAAAQGLSGGAQALRSKLPALVAPNTIVGTIADYFVRKYGLPSACKVAAGSGDNPQTKVLVTGDLLSLGTSFVFMVSTDGNVVDTEGYANAMYDGVDRPFMFGCRTNGAMVWDRVRGLHGLPKKEYARAERALESVAPGSSILLWQPENESFPVSPAFDLRRVEYEKADLAKDYSGIIDSTLAAVYWYSRHFSSASGAGGETAPLYVTGGATGSAQIMRRVAAIWRRPVVAIGKIGAALGTAVAGVSALRGDSGSAASVEELSSSLLPPGDPIPPVAGDAEAYHGEHGYLSRFVDAYDRYRHEP